MFLSVGKAVTISNIVPPDIGRHLVTLSRRFQVCMLATSARKGTGTRYRKLPIVLRAFPANGTGRCGERLMGTANTGHYITVNGNEGSR